MLSNSYKYALKAVLYHGLHSAANHKILAKKLSGPTHVPQIYLAKQLQQLSKYHIVSSSKGLGGGFYLTEENREGCLIEIIDVIDGDSRLNSCMLSLHKCNAEHPCPMHALLGKTKTNFIKNLEETSVYDLVEDIKEGRSFLPL